MGLPNSLVINIFLGVKEQAGAVVCVPILRAGENTGTAATCRGCRLPVSYPY